MKSSALFKSTVVEVCLIIILSALSGLIVNFWVSSKGIALFGEWDVSKGVISAKPITDDPVVHDLEITDIRVAKRIFDNGKAVFLDARSPEDYMDGHIKGAKSTPVNRFEDELENFKTRYPFSTYFVTYCSGRECGDSHKLAQHLLMAGYENVSVFIDGYPAWEAEGFPVEK